ncbi:Beta-galactosidase 8 [Trifolium repens]|nr:Beta-galactosidase 8 [Trifolium repens]WJX89614.1 Beta-galactosidase 8 [Trifolium repens]
MFYSILQSFATESLEEEVDSLDGSSSGWSWVVFNGMSLHKSFFIVPCDSSIWWKRSERALQLVIKFQNFC